MVSAVSVSGNALNPITIFFEAGKLATRLAGTCAERFGRFVPRTMEAKDDLGKTTPRGRLDVSSSSAPQAPVVGAKAGYMLVQATGGGQTSAWHTANGLR